MYLSNNFCSSCGKETTHADGNCCECEKREKEEALERWKAKNLEDKLLDLHLRLQKQEARTFY